MISRPSQPLSRTFALPVVAASLAACSGGDAAPDRAPVESALASSPAGELVARSIAFHDPAGVWGSRTVTLTWTGTGSEGEERVALDLALEPDGSAFSMSGRYRGHEIDYATAGTDVDASVDGSAEIPEDVAERMRLHREDGLFWRSYFGFLAGLPMKLTDPGTHMDPEPGETEFQGRPVRSVRVTYDADVGGDTWYFYFDPESAELVGCRFYHDEAANDGEYIVFEGLAEADGLRLPRRRSWYVNADGAYLGTDEISDLEVTGAAGTR